MPTLVLVSVKPQDVPGLLDEVGADVRADHLVISIAAGVTLRASSGACRTTRPSFV